MSTHFIFPKPRDWNTFEDIVCDVFSRKYHNFNFQRYGRSGQRQSGIDIAGSTKNGLLGVQCKHHPNGQIKQREIEDEIALSEGFTPTLNEFVLATSADRDTEIHQLILKISQERENLGKYPISIKFWDDIFNWLTEYPDLVYKHFTKYFPLRASEHLFLPGIDRSDKTTLVWPTTRAKIKAMAGASIGNIHKSDPYQINLGITSFPDVTNEGITDLDLRLADLFNDYDSPEETFDRGAEILKQVQAELNDPFFAKDLIIHPKVRLSLAFLIGWRFRKVSGYFSFR